MAQPSFSAVSFLLRWAVALVLVFGTFNPTDYSYYGWVTGLGTGNLALKALAGVVIAILYVIYLRATWRSIGPLGVVLATLFVATAAESFRPANGAALAALTPPALRTRAVALNRMALNLGFAIGPAVGGWLAMHSYSLLFWVDGVTCILAALLLKTLFPTEPQGVSEETGASDAGGELHPFKDWAFLAFLGLIVLLTLSFFQGWSTYPVFLNQVYGLAESHFGLLMTLNALLILVFEMVLTHRAEAFRPLSVVGAGTFLFGLGMTVLLLGKGWMLAVVSVIVWTTGEMLAVPAAGGWVANRAGPEHRGKYMGLYTMAWGLGFVLAPTGGSWIYHHLGPTVLWLAVGLLGVLAWIGFELLDRRISPGRGRRGDRPKLADLPSSPS